MFLHTIIFVFSPILITLLAPPSVPMIDTKGPLFESNSLARYGNISIFFFFLCVLVLIHQKKISSNCISCQSWFQCDLRRYALFNSISLFSKYINFFFVLVLIHSVDANRQLVDPQCGAQYHWSYPLMGRVEFNAVCAPLLLSCLSALCLPRFPFRAFLAFLTFLDFLDFLNYFPAFSLSRSLPRFSTKISPLHISPRLRAHCA
jgi:hypothetical protein